MSLPREPLRGRSALSRWQERFGPNMTPMIDVVLVILIFFMAGSTFLGQEWFIKSEMLKRGSATTKQDPLQLPPTRLELKLERTAASGAVVTVENTTMELARFGEWITAFAAGTNKSDIIVIIEPRSTGAGRVTYEEVVRVHEACVAAGIERVGVAEQAPPP
jgi:biopolymer transport protein ExbD